ncbi:MAG: hypothetical protein WCJ30_19775, partial [Deltaproteobacteria bacterium]
MSPSERRTLGIGALALVVAAGACAIRRVPVRSPGFAARQEPSPGVLRARPTQVITTLLPPFDRTVRLGTLTPERSLSAVGGVRIAADRRNRTAAPAVTASTILGGANTAAGWVIACADGSVFLARTFDGALERLGETGRRLAVVRACEGRLVVIDDQGTPWVTDGTSAIHRITGLPVERALSAVFVSERHGAIVFDGGALFATDAGDGAWNRVDLHGGSAMSVFQHEGRRMVVTTLGPRELDDSSHLVDPPAQSPTRCYESSTELREHRSDGVRQVSAVHPALAWLHSGMRRADGTVALRDGRDLVLVSLDSGRDVQRATDLMPSTACTVETWGPSFALACYGDTGRTAL